MSKNAVQALLAKEMKENKKGKAKRKTIESLCETNVKMEDSFNQSWD